jgi:4-alpha-glucanotransferase
MSAADSSQRKLPNSSASDRPLFNWLQQRGAGVLLHPTALPSSFGIGAFDDAAFGFMRFLEASGMSYWQVCPLGPTGFGDSPYQCFSSFAGNPYLVDPLPLVRAGLLSAAALAPLQALDARRVDFGGLYEKKRPLLFAAHAAWCDSGQPALPYGDFQGFRAKHASWLTGYALFSALKDRFGGKPWWELAGRSSFTERSPAGAAGRGAG